MNIRQYLDSTYLTTAAQAGVSEADNKDASRAFIQEAVSEHFKLVMVRPDIVAMAKEMISAAKSKVGVGTVIDFPDGNGGLELKMNEARQAISNGADDLDFVCDYEAFKRDEILKVKEEIFECTALGLASHKTVKWIIETAALDAQQIIRLSSLIKNVVVTNFKEESFANVFVKSSTGFYKTKNGFPNGATEDAIILMLENASPLQVKASGGIKTYIDAIRLIQLGVKRIGTSSAKAIAHGQPAGY